MAVIKSGATSDQLTIDPVSKALRATLYNSEGTELSLGSKTSFSAANTFTPAATPTDMVTIIGSATKTVRVLSFVITTTNTAAGSQTFILAKRSTADTTGTFVPTAGVPHDSDDVATAVAGHYTANPGGLGTLVGNINIVRAASPVLVPATFAGIVFNAGVELLPIVDGLVKPITLNGVAQTLALNFAGAALVAGQIHAYRIVWTEE